MMIACGCTISTPKMSGIYKKNKYIGSKVEGICAQMYSETQIYLLSVSSVSQSLRLVN